MLNSDYSQTSQRIVFDRSVILKAKAFADGCEPSDTAEVVSGTYWLEDFTIRADPPQAHQCFSHWKVIGPLVLDNACASEVTFRWWQGDAEVTLEAVYRANIVPKVEFR